MESSDAQEAEFLPEGVGRVLRSMIVARPARFAGGLGSSTASAARSRTSFASLDDLKGRAERSLIRERVNAAGGCASARAQGRATTRDRPRNRRSDRGGARRGLQQVCGMSYVQDRALDPQRHTAADRLERCGPTWAQEVETKCTETASRGGGSVSTERRENVLHSSVSAWRIAKRSSTPSAAASGTATSKPMKPNSDPKANSANISQTGLSLTRRPMMRGAST